jgi:oligoribonuclease NrnB/cAMP/cGMP phosphodiesterase (DHH superfamily)
MAAAAALSAIQGGNLQCDPDKGLIPINYNVSTPEEFFSDKEDSPYYLAADQGAEEIIFVDFCPKAATVQQLLAYGIKVVILDHHKSAKEDAEKLEGLEGLDLNFDMNKSGAMMAWDYFRGEAPKLVHHVQDRDLWQWKLDYTREIMAWLGAWAETNDPQSYLDAILKFEFTENEIIEVGSMLTAQMDSAVQKMASAFRYAEIPGHGRGIVVNAGVYQSEVCEYLYNRHEVPFVVAYAGTRGGQFSLSFRSKQGAAHSLDVTKIAAEFGGGGHANAAGGVAELEVWTEILQGSEHQ